VYNVSYLLNCADFEKYRNWYCANIGKLLIKQFICSTSELFIKLFQLWLLNSDVSGSQHKIWSPLQWSWAHFSVMWLYYKYTSSVFGNNMKGVGCQGCTESFWSTVVLFRTPFGISMIKLWPMFTFTKRLLETAVLSCLNMEQLSSHHLDLHKIDIGIFTKMCWHTRSVQKVSDLNFSRLNKASTGSVHHCRCGGDIYARALIFSCL